MSIVAADLAARACANFAVENDTSTAGGAMTTSTGYDIVSDAGGGAQGYEVLSSAPADNTQNVITRMWLDVGTLSQSSVLLNGTTAVSVGGINATRVVHLDIDAAYTGTITLRVKPAGATIATLTLGPGIYTETAVTRMFIFAFSTVAGITRYDKMFWVNSNATLTAISPVYRLTADPQTRIRQGVSVSVNDSATIANRVTAPGGITFVDDNIDQTGGDLPSASKQGVWIEFASTANDPNAPFASSFTTQITVNSI